MLIICLTVRCGGPKHYGVYEKCSFMNYFWGFRSLRQEQIEVWKNKLNVSEDQLNEEQYMERHKNIICIEELCSDQGPNVQQFSPRNINHMLSIDSQRAYRISSSDFQNQINQSRNYFLSPKKVQDSPINDPFAILTPPKISLEKSEPKLSKSSLKVSSPHSTQSRRKITNQKHETMHEKEKQINYDQDTCPGISERSFKRQEQETCPGVTERSFKRQERETCPGISERSYKQQFQPTTQEDEINKKELGDMISQDSSDRNIREPEFLEGGSNIAVPHETERELVREYAQESGQSDSNVSDSLANSNSQIGEKPKIDREAIQLEMTLQAHIRVHLASAVRVSQRYTTLFSGLRKNTPNNVAVIYPLTFLARRICFATLIIFMLQFPIMQVFILLLICLVFITFALTEKQWEDFRIAFQHMVNEVALYVSLVAILVCNVLTIPSAVTILGWCVILLALGTMMFNLIFIAMSSVRECKHRARVNRMKLRKQVYYRRQKTMRRRAQKLNKNRPSINSIKSGNSYPESYCSARESCLDDQIKVQIKSQEERYKNFGLKNKSRFSENDFAIDSELGSNRNIYNLQRDSQIIEEEKQITQSFRRDIKLLKNSMKRSSAQENPECMSPTDIATCSTVNIPLKQATQISLKKESIINVESPKKSPQGNFEQISKLILSSDKNIIQEEESSEKDVISHQEPQDKNGIGDFNSSFQPQMDHIQCVQQPKSPEFKYEENFKENLKVQPVKEHSQSFSLDIRSRQTEKKQASLQGSNKSNLSIHLEGQPRLETSDVKQKKSEIMLSPNKQGSIVGSIVDFIEEEPHHQLNNDQYTKSPQKKTASKLDVFIQVSRKLSPRKILDNAMEPEYDRSDIEDQLKLLSIKKSHKTQVQSKRTSMNQDTNRNDCDQASIQMYKNSQQQSCRKFNSPMYATEDEGVSPTHLIEQSRNIIPKLEKQLPTEEFLLIQKHLQNLDKTQNDSNAERSQQDLNIAQEPVNLSNHKSQSRLKTEIHNNLSPSLILSDSSQQKDEEIGTSDKMIKATDNEHLSAKVGFIILTTDNQLKNLQKNLIDEEEKKQESNKKHNGHVLIREEESNHQSIDHGSQLKESSKTGNHEVKDTKFSSSVQGGSLEQANVKNIFLIKNSNIVVYEPSFDKKDINPLSESVDQHSAPPEKVENSNKKNKEDKAGIVSKEPSKSAETTIVVEKQSQELRIEEESVDQIESIPVIEQVKMTKLASNADQVKGSRMQEGYSASVATAEHQHPNLSFQLQESRITWVNEQDSEENDMVGVNEEKQKQSFHQPSKKALTQPVSKPHSQISPMKKVADDQITEKKQPGQKSPLPKDKISQLLDEIKQKSQFTEEHKIIDDERHILVVSPLSDSNKNSGLASQISTMPIRQSLGVSVNIDVQQAPQTNEGGSDFKEKSQILNNEKDQFNAVQEERKSDQKSVSDKSHMLKMLTESKSSVGQFKADSQNLNDTSPQIDDDSDNKDTQILIKLKPIEKIETKIFEGSTHIELEPSVQQHQQVDASDAVLVTNQASNFDPQASFDNQDLQSEPLVEEIRHLGNAKVKQADEGLHFNSSRALNRYLASQELLLKLPNKLYDAPLSKQMSNATIAQIQLDSSLSKLKMENSITPMLLLSKISNKSLPPLNTREMNRQKTHQQNMNIVSQQIGPQLESSIRLTPLNPPSELSSRHDHRNPSLRKESLQTQQDISVPQLLKFRLQGQQKDSEEKKITGDDLKQQIFTQSIQKAKSSFPLVNSSLKVLSNDSKSQHSQGSDFKEMVNENLKKMQYSVQKLIDMPVEQNQFQSPRYLQSGIIRSQNFGSAQYIGKNLERATLLSEGDLSESTAPRQTINAIVARKNLSRNSTNNFLSPHHKSYQFEIRSNASSEAREIDAYGNALSIPNDFNALSSKFKLQQYFKDPRAMTEGRQATKKHFQRKSGSVNQILPEIKEQLPKLKTDLQNQLTRGRKKETSKHKGKKLNTHRGGSAYVCPQEQPQDHHGFFINNKQSKPSMRLKGIYGQNATSFFDNNTRQNILTRSIIKESQQKKQQTLKTIQNSQERDVSCESSTEKTVYIINAKRRRSKRNRLI